MTERLRITGGSRRGRRLLSPPKNTIRPASDLIRQAVFNMLGDRVVGCVFYDVFAGTGIVGMEALSRGARRAIFIERDHRQIGLIRRNLERADFGPEAVVRGSDAFAWSRHFVPEGDRRIVFLGPPYPDFDEMGAELLELVANVQRKLSGEDVMVLQFPRAMPPSELPDAEHWWRMRRYGKSQVGLWSASPPEVDEEPIEEDLPEHETEIDENLVEDDDGETGAD